MASGLGLGAQGQSERGLRGLDGWRHGEHSLANSGAASACCTAWMDGGAAYMAGRTVAQRAWSVQPAWLDIWRCSECGRCGLRHWTATRQAYGLRSLSGRRRGECEEVPSRAQYVETHRVFPTAKSSFLSQETVLSIFLLFLYLLDCHVSFFPRGIETNINIALGLSLIDIQVDYTLSC